MSSSQQQVELENNIGKMVISNIETGNYEVDKLSLQAAKNLTAKKLSDRLFCTGIRYKVAALFSRLREQDYP